jgi:hypothetical protein
MFQILNGPSGTFEGVGPLKAFVISAPRAGVDLDSLQSPPPPHDSTDIDDGAGGGGLVALAGMWPMAERIAQLFAPSKNRKQGLGSRWLSALFASKNYRGDLGGQGDARVAEFRRAYASGVDVNYLRALSVIVAGGVAGIRATSSLELIDSISIFYLFFITLAFSNVPLSSLKYRLHLFVFGAVLTNLIYATCADARPLCAAQVAFASTAPLLQTRPAATQVLQAGILFCGVSLLALVVSAHAVAPHAAASFPLVLTAAILTSFLNAVSHVQHRRMADSFLGAFASLRFELSRRTERLALLRPLAARCVPACVSADVIPTPPQFFQTRHITAAQVLAIELKGADYLLSFNSDGEVFAEVANFVANVEAFGAARGVLKLKAAGALFIAALLPSARTKRGGGGLFEFVDDVASYVAEVNRTRSPPLIARFGYAEGDINVPPPPPPAGGGAVHEIFLEKGSNHGQNRCAGAACGRRVVCGL